MTKSGLIICLLRLCFLTLCSGRNLGFRRYGFDLDSLDLFGRYRFRRGRILGGLLGFLTAGSHASGHYDYSCCNE